MKTWTYLSRAPGEEGGSRRLEHERREAAMNGPGRLP